jgi:hypothetical protein
VYRKATDFCVWILYPATLLKVFMKYEFLVEFLGSFDFFIPYLNPFSFSCLIALSRNFIIVLSKNQDTLVSFLSLEEMPSIFFSLATILSIVYHI